MIVQISLSMKITAVCPSTSSHSDISAAISYNNHMEGTETKERDGSRIPVRPTNIHTLYIAGTRTHRSRCHPPCKTRTTTSTLLDWNNFPLLELSRVLRRLLWCERIYGTLTFMGNLTDIPGTLISQGFDKIEDGNPD